MARRKAKRSDPVQTPSAQGAAVTSKKEPEKRQWLSIISLITGVIGIGAAIFAVYVWIDSWRTREVVAEEIWPRSYIGHRTANPDIGVTYKDQPVAEGRITLIKIKVWNRGDEIIRVSNILEDVQILLPNCASILDAEVIAASRDVAQFKARAPVEVDGVWRVPVSWELLEQGDGGVIQIMAAGRYSDLVHIGGIIEGRVPVKGVSTARGRFTRQYLFNAILWSGVWLFSIAWVIRDYRKHGRLNWWRLTWQCGAMAIFFLYIYLWLSAMIAAQSDLSLPRAQTAVSDSESTPDEHRPF